MTLPARSDLKGFEHAPHTVSTPLLQFDTLYCPVWHTVQFPHAEPVVMPTPVEYVPERQEIQAVGESMAVPLEYVPAKQAEHADPDETLMPVLNFPAEHGMQAETVTAPVPVPYVPAKQRVQVPDCVAPFPV